MFYLVAVVRLRKDEPDTDSFAIFSLDRRLLKHEDKAIDTPEPFEAASYMLYYSRGPRLSDPSKQRCRILPPLLSDRPATKEQIAFRDELVRQSMEAVELAEEAAQDRLRSRHGSLVSRPRTESPSRVPEQHSHASPKGAVGSHPMRTDESPLFNFQTPQPAPKEVSSGPSSSFFSSSGTAPHLIQGLHVKTSFESPADQRASSDRNSGTSSSGFGVKRSIEQDYDSSGRKRQRSDSRDLLNSPLDSIHNARGSSFERDHHGPGSAQSHSGREEPRRMETAQQPTSQPSQRATSWGQMEGVFGFPLDSGRETPAPSQGVRHSSQPDYDLEDEEFLHESRRNMMFGDEHSYHERRYEEHPRDYRGSYRGRGTRRSSGYGYQHYRGSGRRDRYY